MHVVLPWLWPSHGSYLSQGLTAVAWILHESGLPPTGTRTYGLEAIFLLSLLLFWTVEARCLSWEMSLGDVKSGRPVDFSSLVPWGVPPCVDFDFWSTPGNKTVHKPPSLELTLVSAKRLRPRPLSTWHSCLYWIHTLELPRPNPGQLQLSLLGNQAMCFLRRWRQPGDNRLCILQSATSINGDYFVFSTTRLSLVHVITLDDLIGTQEVEISATYVALRANAHTVYWFDISPTFSIVRHVDLLTTIIHCRLRFSQCSKLLNTSCHFTVSLSSSLLQTFGML